MKKLIALTLALVMCISLFPVVSVNAAILKSGNLYYSVTNDVATITGQDTSFFVDYLTIPVFIAGYPVVAIGSFAFSDNTDITIVEVPDSVTTIGDAAFSNCTSLTDINVDDSNPNYISVDGVLFNKDITELVAYPGGKTETEYIIPNSVTTIRDFAFEYCTSLTDVYYGGTEEQWNEIFVGCSNDALLNANIHFAEAPEAAVLEYVLGLNAFNKANMVFGSNVPSDPSYPTVAPVLDNRTGALIFMDAMHWDYTIPAEYAANGEAFNAMDLSKTAPWAVEAYKLTTTVPMLRDDVYAIGFSRTSYTKDDPAFVAFRLKVDAPGEYVLKAKAVSVDYSAVPAVYFFKDGTDGVVNGDVFTYPASSKIGYFDTVNSKSAYATLGSVNVESAGEYIIAFVGDPTSAELNESYAPNNMLQMQPFSLSGIKLVPSDNEEVAGITLWADNKNLFVGDEIALDLSADMSALGEVELDASDVTFSVMPEGVVSVSDNGIVTAVGVGEATVTATLKSDSSKTASISFKNIENPNGFVYTVINEEVTIDAYEGEIDGPLTIPATLGGGYPVRIIGNDAFSSCWETLTELVIPDGVTTIGIRAFDCCGILSKIKIPASVTVIEESAFWGCDSLADVYYGGTEEEWNEISIGEVNDSLLNATIHFAGETPACDVTVYTEAKTSVAKGSKFTYTVSLEGTYDGFAFDIVPAAGFTITEMTASNSDINVDELTGKFRISVLGALGKVDSEKEAILTVSVEVEEDAEIGPCELGLTNLLVTDDCGDQIVNIKYEYATIEVKDCVPGDMNGDEKFDYVDVVKLYAFFREKAEIEEYIDVDVNGDGVFSYLDVSKLYAIYRGKAEFK